MCARDSSRGGGGRFSSTSLLCGIIYFYPLALLLPINLVVLSLLRIYTVCAAHAIAYGNYILLNESHSFFFSFFLEEKNNRERERERGTLDLFRSRARAFIAGN